MNGGSSPTPRDPRPAAVVSWSSGKDAAFALYETLRRGELRVVGLLTTVSEEFDRVSMHGVRSSILRAQAAATGLPLHTVAIPYPCPNAEYERRMGAAVAALRAAGVRHVVFGDLFLEDVRRYREERLAGTGIEPSFPLWGRPTAGLAREMIDAGLRATLVAIDPRHLSREFAGREFDRTLLDELPAAVDPCGERGEFHTCVTAGPFFRSPLPVRTGRVVDRDGFVFRDLLLPEETDAGGDRPALTRASR